jgi:transcriptional regulator with XRE-family HTH domain
MNEQIQKSRRIGELLRSTRVQKRVSVSKCAAVLGTTRRRYTAIEAGESMIGALELERLCDFLGLSLLVVLPPSTVPRIHRIGVLPGEYVELFLEGE